ncbi:hypothetical protein LINGRAHAP2_LOCUS31367, partial [Linum grandiflorum]
MQARPMGHLIESPDMSDATTSKQKPRYHKLLPYVFHSYVTAEQMSSPIPSSDASGSSSTVTVPTAPLISDLHDMQLADKKQARDDEEAGASNSNPKRIKLPPLQISDFPEVVELNMACDQESRYWRQKCRNDWMESGDRNTAFFHRTTVARQRYNQLGTLSDSLGNVYETETEKCNHAATYFANLFSTDRSAENA